MDPMPEPRSATPSDDTPPGAEPTPETAEPNAPETAAPDTPETAAPDTPETAAPDTATRQAEDTATARTGSAPVRRASTVTRVVAPFRNAWRVLTAMRTALLLLFMLAIAAVPGALLPQRSLNQGKVDAYIAEHGRLGEIYDKLQLFDVFSSWWFTAIYVLLFVSLVGCLTPRTFELVRQLRTPPPLTPRNLNRLPHHASFRSSATPQQAAQRIQRHLKGWRVTRRDRDGRVAGAIELSAERGYLREVGNIVFHFALLALLVCFAAGKFVYAEGMRVLVADPAQPAFCNTTPAAYDSFRGGVLVDGTSLTPFCVHVEDFSADYLPNGQAEMFSSNIRYSDTVSTADPSTWEPYHLQVNHPLRVNGARVYLQGHGYAPTFTVTYPNGETRTDTVQWQPNDMQTFLSSGVMRFDPPSGLYPDLEERRKHQIAVQGLFAPTAQFTGKILGSSYPAPNDPAVAIDVYQGDAGLDTGRPQSLFSLDRGLIESGELEKKARVNLRPGESTTLADGTKVRFDGAEQFVNLQISDDPTQTWVGVSAAVMMAGLLLSLTIRRRRIWARVTSADDGTTLIDLGGLARTDRAGWGREFDELRDALVLPDDAPGGDNGPQAAAAPRATESPSDAPGDRPRKDGSR